MASLGRASHKSERSPSSSLSSSLNSSSSITSSRNNGGSVGVHRSNGRRPVTPTSKTRSLAHDHDPESERVRVAVRLRPRNPEDLSDADYTDCVELQPELKRLKLKKNNWSSEAYRFDEVFTESASQKRVYEAVAKPVVESVLDGYNGTVMAYGQTGTGKTYTLGRLGKDDVSERGMMVRALEDILVSTSASDSVEISYVQLYMESIQDLLAPEKINIPIVEDAKTGEVSVPGAAIVKIRNLDQFLHFLQLGEVNRHAANTKMNTESSRSHAILMVYIRRSIREKEEKDIYLKENNPADRNGHHLPTIRKSKLLLVDLAGSERIDKSGSEGHLLEEAKFINLSLTSLGKCINALAENSPHIPTRDSKLTRLLRDSFGGSARTSLIITIGPSYRHHQETATTVMFGQRAMKVVNTVKVKEEFDYESLCRKLEARVDHLTSEIDRQQKWRDIDRTKMEKKLEEFHNSSVEAEKRAFARSELLMKENTQLTSKMKDLLQGLDSQKHQNELLINQIARLETSLKNSKFLEEENARLELNLNDVMKDLNRQKEENNIMHNEVVQLKTNLKHIKQQQLENSTYQKVLADTTQMYEEKIADLMKQIEDETMRSNYAEEENERMKKQITDIQMAMQQNQVENCRYQKELAGTSKMYDERMEALNQHLEDEHAHAVRIEEELRSTKRLLREYQDSAQINSEKEIDELKRLQEMQQLYETTAKELGQLSINCKNLESEKINSEKEINELQKRLQEMQQLYETTAKELGQLSINCKNLESEKETLENELHAIRQSLQIEERRRKEAETELLNISKGVPESDDGFEEKISYVHETKTNGSSSLQNPQSSHNSSRSRETILSRKNTITRICEEVGLEKILSLLESEDLDVQIHAVKVVANLAAEDINQEKIVQEGGLDALLMLVESSENTTILRVASGAIANLAMNEMNQGLITSKGGAQLLASAASRTDDPQTLRMVAGAIANLCGNEKLHVILKENGAIKALLGMTRSGNTEVIAQVARGLANFAKCESRRIMQGRWSGRSRLMEDGALSWLVANLNTTSTSTRRHVELAICHLAQNEENARDFISTGGLKELIGISGESAREDIRNLAKKTLRLSPLFRGELRAE